MSTITTPVEETTTQISFIREATANKILNQFVTCDSCPTRSAVVVFAPDSDDVALSFCNHHARKNSETLEKSGFALFPESYKF